MNALRIYFVYYFLICATSMPLEYEPRYRLEGTDRFLVTQWSKWNGGIPEWHQVECEVAKTSEYRILWYFVPLKFDGTEDWKKKVLIRYPSNIRFILNSTVLHVLMTAENEGSYQCRAVDRYGGYQEYKVTLLVKAYRSEENLGFPRMELDKQNRMIISRVNSWEPIRVVTYTKHVYEDENDRIRDDGTYFVSEEIPTIGFKNTVMSRSLPSNTFMWYSFAHSNLIKFFRTYPEVPTNAMEIVEINPVPECLSVLRLKIRNDFLDDTELDAQDLEPFKMVRIRAYPLDRRIVLERTFHEDEYECCEQNCTNKMSCFTVDFYGLSPNAEYSFTTRWIYEDLEGVESKFETGNTLSDARPYPATRIDIVSLTSTSMKVRWDPPDFWDTSVLYYLVALDDDERPEIYWPIEPVAEFRYLQPDSIHKLNISVVARNSKDVAFQVFHIRTLGSVEQKGYNILLSLQQEMDLCLQLIKKHTAELEKLGGLSQEKETNELLQRTVEDLNLKLEDNVVVSSGFRGFLVVVETVLIAMLLSFLHYASLKQSLLNKERAKDHENKASLKTAKALAAPKK
ncbi:hypothetical protein V3C99_010302 [Haemonchus contortus]